MMIGKSIIAMVALLVASSNGQHYEHPPCGPDEKPVEVWGIVGVFCSPECSPGCPTDVPDGVTLTPSCAVHSADGSKRCGILCDDQEPGCGPMTCLHIPNRGGLGFCVYPMSEELRASTDIQMTFADEIPVAMIE